MDKKMTTLGLALALLAGAAPSGYAAPKQGNAAMAGAWKVQVPGQPPTPAGALSLRSTRQGTLSGTFTPPGGHAEPLKGVQASNERLSFRFTLSGGKKAGQTFTGRFAPTLDADAWTGRLSGLTGSLAVDLVRR